MDAHLSKACWRAGAKLLVGFALIGAVVGVRIVTAKPTGIEAEIAELERFEAEQAASQAGGPGAEAGVEGDSVAGADEGAPSMIGGRSAAASEASARSDGEAGDLDRLVRCRLGGSTQFMRAADCATRGGTLEELPPPEPEDPTAVQTTP